MEHPTDLSDHPIVSRTMASLFGDPQERKIMKEKKKAIDRPKGELSEPA